MEIGSGISPLRSGIHPLAGTPLTLQTGAVNTFDSPFAPRRRSLRFRSSALAWALAVAFGLFADVFAERACPHHEVGGHGEHQTDPVGGAASGAHAHGDHHHGAGYPPGEEAEESGTHSDPCLCLGSCQAGTSIALLAAPLQRLSEAAVTPGAGVVRLADAHLPGRVPFVLPYSNAPPVPV